MAAPTPPDLTSVMLPFDPVSYWAAGDFDPFALVAALKQQPGLADFPDDAGNTQCAVRLDGDADEGNVGYWVSVPRGTAEKVVQAAADQVDPPAPPPPPDPFVPASVAVQTAVAAVMATVKITSPTLTKAQAQQIQDNVTAAAQAVVDNSLGA